jgi:hypothetical protein
MTYPYAERLPDDGVDARKVPVRWAGGDLRDLMGVPIRRAIVRRLSRV